MLAVAAMALVHLAVGVYMVEESLYVIPQHRIALCVPSKNGCTVVSRIFHRINKVSGSHWTSSFPSRHNISDVRREIYADPSWTTGIIVRHPVERIKSAWKSKCVNRESGIGMCHNIFGKNASSHINDAVAKLLIAPNLARSDRHIHPQVDYCYGIKDFVNNITFKFQYIDGMLSKQLTEILERGGVPSDNISSAFKTISSHNSHITASTDRMLSAALSTRISSLYKDDIKVFGILPQPRIEVLLITMNMLDVVQRNVESLWRRYAVFVRIADDGPEDMSAEYNAYCRFRLCTYTYFGFDRGISYKRNRLAEAAQTEKVFFVDADQIWTDKSDLVLAERILDDGADTVSFSGPGGAVFAGKFWDCEDDLVCRCPSHRDPWPSYNVGCFKSDVGQNQFLTRRSLVLNNPWPDHIKTHEHQLFFYGLKINTTASVVSCRGLTLGTKRGNRPGWYNRLRYRHVEHNMTAEKNTKCP